MKKELKHVCHQNRFKDTDIRYEKINKEQWSWVLEQWHHPESQRVNNDEIRSMSYCNTLLISFCPFCGENLSKDEPNDW